MVPFTVVLAIIVLALSWLAWRAGDDTGWRP